ncbi:hypothetical protein ACJX0J_034627 [Zea mays]
MWKWKCHENSEKEYFAKALQIISSLVSCAPFQKKATISSVTFLFLGGKYKYHSVSIWEVINLRKRTTKKGGLELRRISIFITQDLIIHRASLTDDYFSIVQS